MNETKLNQGVVLSKNQLVLKLISFQIKQIKLRLGQIDN